MTTHNESSVVIRYGQRGQMNFATMAQADKHPAKLELRKWLSANGVYSSYAAKLGFGPLEQAWNDTSDSSLEVLKIEGEEYRRNGQVSPAVTPINHEEPAPMHTPVAAVAAAVDTSNPLAPLLAYLQGQIGNAVNESAVRNIVQDNIDALMASLPTLIADHSPVKTLVIKRPDETEYKIDGRVHPKFETLLKVASSRQANGRHPNIMLSGPTGSGKTHAVEQLAKALDLEFYTNGAISMDHQLLGFKDAAGNYHETPLRKAFGRPAVYLFDEIDSSDNSPLLALAGALANGGTEFPDMFVERHPDSIIIAAGNTWGNGATAEFVGRNKLDGAIKSRFPVRISWDYDEELERQISGNVSWAKRVQNARANARKAGVKVTIDPRMTQAGAAIIAAGLSEQEAAELTYLAELTPEQRTMVDAI